MHLRSFRPTVLAAVAVFAASCSPTDYVKLYDRAPHAPSLEPAKIAALEHMGTTVLDQGVNFALYSENATRVDLLLFNDPESDVPTRVIDNLQKIPGSHVYNVYVEGIGYGQHYGYRAWGPNWPYDPAWYPGSIIGFLADVDAQGNRYNPNKLLLDPYAKALHRDHDWSKGSVATGPARAQVTYAASSKGVIVESTFQWSDEEIAYRKNRENENFVGHHWKDMILYEVHLKGFTADKAGPIIDGRNVGVQFPGTYRAFGESADYFKDLGITAVEVLPIHEKPLDGGYWGYQTLNFFAPEITYAAMRRPHEVIDEFKWMVQEFHKRGIEVIVDVVYNHTGEGGLWREKIDIAPGIHDEQLANHDPKEVTGIYSFRGIDNRAYYALTPDNQFYWDDTGVGNQTRANHAPMRKLILDSLRFYVEELHVDGFRFDLAPILGVDPKTHRWEDVRETVIQDAIDDPLMQRWNTRMISEPWAFNVGVRTADFPAAEVHPGNGWYAWNGGFRDWWRLFINEDGHKLNTAHRTYDRDIRFWNAAAPEWFEWNRRKPYHSVNFITVHDGFPLYDVFTYEQKYNKCGPLNPVCCERPLSPFCDRDSGTNENYSRNWGFAGEPMKRQLMRNAFAAMLFSHGTPMLYGGDEWMRTQLGNNNAYSTGADNPFNWFQWGSWVAQDERHRMYDFVKQMIRFRKDHAYAFAPTEYGEGAPYAWKSAANTDAVIWDSKHVMLHYYDRSRGPEIAILINMENVTIPFTLPEGRDWKVVVDTQSTYDVPTYLTANGLPSKKTANVNLEAPTSAAGTYEVLSRTIVILEAK